MKKNLKKIITIGTLAVAMTVCSACSQESSSSSGRTERQDKKSPFEQVEEENEIENQDLFYDYLNEVLIAQYGLAQTEQTGVMHTWEDEWLQPEGILSAKIADFDGDEEEEMLLVRIAQPDSEGGYPIMLEMYEADDGNVRQAADMRYGAYRKNGDGEIWNTTVSLSRAQWADLVIQLTMVKVNDQNYIVCEQQLVAATFADGSDQNYWILSYRDEELKYEASFSQTDGGSSGFAYTGYYFENGNLQSEELLFAEEAEYEDVKPTYTNFSDALKGLFGKYGIQLRQMDYAYSSDYMFDDDGGVLTQPNILSEENDMESIVGYSVRCINSDYNRKQYDYKAEVKDDTQLAEHIEEKTDVVETEEDEDINNGQSDTNAYKSAFKGFLMEYKNRNNTNGEEKFALIYIDEDDIPELVIGMGSFHIAGLEVYVYHNGEVVQLGDSAYGSYGSLAYVEKGNMFCSFYEQGGRTSEGYYSVKDGKENVIAKFYNDEDAMLGEGTATYEYNDTAVSKQEYETRLDEINGRYPNTTMIEYSDCLEITEANIDSLLQ